MRLSVEAAVWAGAGELGVSPLIGWLVIWTEMEIDRYLLGELLWELAKFGVTVPDLTDVPPEEIEVVSHSGGDKLRLRTARGLFDARLDWSAQAAPVVTRSNGGAA